MLEIKNVPALEPLVTALTDAVSKDLKTALQALSDPDLYRTLLRYLLRWVVCFRTGPAGASEPIADCRLNFPPLLTRRKVS